MTFFRKRYRTTAVFLSLGLIAACAALRETAPRPGEAASAGRRPRISPDYADVVMPPNIAPLNFRVLEPCDRAVLTLEPENGPVVEVKSGDGAFRIPIKVWRNLLSRNKGRLLTYRVRVKNSGRWITYEPFNNRIAEQPIDSRLAYRLINPAFSLWTVMGLFQRDLETFEEKPILLNRLTQDNCMNCHHFKTNDPEWVMLHLRGGKGSGTLIRTPDGMRKVDTSTDFNKAGSYPAWHPDGGLIAFSANSLTMFFHSRGESRDVLDAKSDIVVYDIGGNRITSAAGLADPERMETFPCWAPDGRALYFCAADRLERYVGERQGREDLFWETIRYDLMRIAFDPGTGAWGRPQTVLSAKTAGGSITEPRVSPDGRFLMFTLADYGNFPVYLESADLHLLDLATGRVKKLECNSGRAESFHSWSGGGGWFVFTSKRMDGLLGRPYFSRLDSAGAASKPFVLPQKDPAFYDTFLKTYNVPELAAGEIRIGPRDWAKTAHAGPAVKAGLDPVLKPLSGPAGAAESPDLYHKAKR
ncbi:PD40 domain-containing protein [bacterium]|nr:PD40 domain-containing protein [bacterium]